MHRFPRNPIISRPLSLIALLAAGLLATGLFTTGLGAQEKGEGKGEAKGAPEAAAAKVDFRKQVWPLLEEKCVECHRAAYTDENGKKRKPKGRIEFDSVAGIKKSKKGKLIVARHADKSLMIEALTLPADDEDRMPPAKKGPPLPKEEIDMLKRWIDEGADFGDWKSWDEEKKKAEKGSDGDKKAAPEKGSEKGTDKPARKGGA